HDYDLLSPWPQSTTAAIPSDQPAIHGAWAETLGQVMAPIQPGLARLAQAGALVPVIGLELADDKGSVVADAEIGWTDAKVVVLRADQSDMVDAWSERGWKALCLDESL